MNSSSVITEKVHQVTPSPQITILLLTHLVLSQTTHWGSTNLVHKCFERVRRFRYPSINHTKESTRTRAHAPAKGNIVHFSRWSRVSSMACRRLGQGLVFRSISP